MRIALVPQRFNFFEVFFSLQELVEGFKFQGASPSCPGRHSLNAT
jgi:hypothetical protein